MRPNLTKNFYRQRGNLFIRSRWAQRVVVLINVASTENNDDGDDNDFSFFTEEKDILSFCVNGDNYQKFYLQA